MARDLEDVAASFLTELPRVTDLLGLVDPHPLPDAQGTEL